MDDLKKKLKNKKTKKTKKNKHIMKGGTDIIRASIDMVKSMVKLGSIIGGEIASIKNIPNDINNLAKTDSIPNNNLHV